MRVGRTVLAALAVVVLVVLTPGAAATAAEPVVPVTPIPDLPSNTIRMTPTSTGSWTASDWWRAVIWKAAQPGTEVATLPTTGTKVATVAKPITPAATFARGAAGGPLVGAFLGGFAIGQGGLQLYGAVTGDDPLDEVCGTGWEGVSSFLYIGMMPDCQGVIEQANSDISTTATLTYQGVSFSIRNVHSYPRQDVSWSYCTTLAGSTPTPSGYVLVARKPDGGWENAPMSNTTNPSFAPCLNAGNGVWSFLSMPSVVGHPPHLAWRQQSTGQIVAEQQTSSADPVRTPRCHIDWEDGTTTVGTGVPYRETEGFPLSTVGTGCKSAWDAKPGAGPDLLPSQIGVESEQGGAITEIATQEVPDMAPEQRRALEAVPGNGRGLVLEKTVDGSVKSCNTWEVDCAQWWTQTSEGTSTTSPYRCTFGGNLVSLTECGPYRRTFDAPTTSPTITDPSTGQEVPWSGPATNPGTIADGVTGGGACGAAWSWNPVDWVLNPIKCAFIPSTAKVTATQTAIATAWAPTVFGQLPIIVGDVFEAPTGDESCQGPHIYMDFAQYWDGWPVVDWYPLNACEEPVSHVATLARTIGAAILIYLTALGIVRRISATVQAPGLGAGAAS